MSNVEVLARLLQKKLYPPFTHMQPLEFLRMKKNSVFACTMVSLRAVKFALDDARPIFTAFTLDLRWQPGKSREV
jgi:hypothetical protein